MFVIQNIQRAVQASVYAFSRRKPHQISCMLCGDTRKVPAGSDAFLCVHCEKHHF